MLLRMNVRENSAKVKRIFPDPEFLMGRTTSKYIVTPTNPFNNAAIGQAKYGLNPQRRTIVYVHIIPTVANEV